MKIILRLFKNFWFVTPALWLAGILVFWFLLHRQSWTPSQFWQAASIISAFWVLTITLSYYKRIRVEKNLEHLVQNEADRSLDSSTGLRDQHVLRERLKHAIKMLQTDRSAGGGGSSALHDLPWYLIIGKSEAGKTSLLTRSNLSTRIALSANDTASDTQHCDWYFSPDAVMIDTAGHYLRDDSPANGFTDFLRMLGKQRGKAAINGLVLVVSLPELLTCSTHERTALAVRLVSRIEEYADCLNANPPIYLMLSKSDHLPGFSQAFDGLDNHERQQPMGMTFGLSEILNEGLHAVLTRKLAGLHKHISQYVDAQVATLGTDATSALLNFPSYVAELSPILEPFLQHFTQREQGGTPLLLRGVYFTSALQTGQQLTQTHENNLAESFALHTQKDLQEPIDEKNEPAQGRSYFITNTLRNVIFPDRDLTLYQSRRSNKKKLTPVVITSTLLVALSFIGWESLSFQNNRQWIASLRQQLSDLAQPTTRDQQLGQGLELLRDQLTVIEKYQNNGIPLQLSGGLYRRNDSYLTMQAAYFQQLRIQVLEPIALKLQLKLRAFNAFAKTMDAPKGPAIRLTDAVGQPVLTAGKSARGSESVQQPVAAVGLSLSEDMVGRLDEQQVASIIESYNALKLYLILTHPKRHPDADFVSTALPIAWADASNQGPFQASGKVIEDNTRFYAQRLKQAPSLPRDDALIDATRESLKSFMISSSLVEREYLKLQLESSRQFPALGLAGLVPLPGRTSLYGAEVIPAMFTRQGWDAFVKPELIKLVSGNLQNESDWVLDGEGGDVAVQKANFIREFMARYKRDYAHAWYTLIGSVGVRHFTDMANATQQLSLLSDVQNSPLKHLLAAVNDNTQWDLPASGEIRQANINISDGFDNQRPSLPSVNPLLPGMDDGSLAKRFSSVSRLFTAQNAEGPDSTIMDRYLASLRKLKVRMNNIQRAQNIGKSSKQLISETLEGQPSEVTVARNYVETTIDTSQGSLSTSLQGLLNLPIQFAWETLRNPAGEQIAKAWSQQIAKPWAQVMAHRYPIAAGSRNEASVKDLLRFVDPQSGLLPNFKRNEIGNLADGEGFGMNSGSKAPPVVNPRLVNSIDKASALGEVIASLSDSENGFEIMLEPSPYYTDIIFTLDGQVQHYRNGKTSWNRFSWPGTTTAPGARLDVITLTGERITLFDYPGRWGLLRMNDSARVEDLDGIQQRFNWKTANGQVSLTVRNYGGVKLTDLKNVKALSVLNTAEVNAK